MPDSIPLSPFEELMLHQDSTAYPASCFIRLKFSGRLDERAFRTAARLTVERHPLLHASVQKSNGYHWIPGEIQPFIRWTDDACGEDINVSHLDIRQEHGLRLFVQLREDSSELLIQLHHSSCDGIAIYQVVRDLLITYSASLPDGPDIKPPKLNHDLLTGRAATGLKPLARMKLVSQQAARIPSVCRFFARTPVPLVVGGQRPLDGPTPNPFPALHSHHFDKSTSSQIRDTLSAPITLNDLLTRDLFLAMRDFRKYQNLDSETRWLRLMIPVSLRRIEQFRASAANMIGAVFLDRRGVAMRNPDRFLAGISRETERIKRLKLGHLFNFALFAQRRIPGGLKQAARTTRRQVSAVFTNVGRVLTKSALPKIDGRWICGNVILQSTESAAPIAPDVCCAFAATWYANRLTLTLHADSHVMSAQATTKMLSLFVGRVRMSAGLEPVRQELSTATV